MPCMLGGFLCGLERLRDMYDEQRGAIEWTLEYSKERMCTYPTPFEASGLCIILVLRAGLNPDFTTETLLSGRLERLRFRRIGGIRS